MVIHRLKEILRKRRYRRWNERVNDLEEGMKGLSNEDLPEKMSEFYRRRRKGEDLLDLLPEVFALVREASRRTIDIRQYDVQVRAAEALAEGRVIEMDTGEGKTFVAPLAAVLHALERRGVHVMTANDYLAERDHDILQPVYDSLGLSAGVILADSAPSQRRKAYNADITYTTVRQAGFDYLREYFQQTPEALRRRNMWAYLRSDIDGADPAKRALGGRHFAILDEADKILIDDGRKPLSITVEAETQRPKEVYTRAREFALQKLEKPEDYTVDKVRREIKLTDRGRGKIDRLQDRYGHLHQMFEDWVDRLKEALEAEHFLEEGTDYVVQKDQAVLIEPSSGRLMSGQRLGGELHQALEAKEGLPIRDRRRVAKKVTIQSLIRPYTHVAGMSGTVWEARREFSRIYEMEAVRFEPRKPRQRRWESDFFFVDSEARWQEVVRDIKDTHETGQPVLAATRSVDSSELLSSMLEAEGITHEVLNATDHAREAEILSDAGQKGSVTIAARLAGRGVEIKLGDGVAELGGLRVLGAQKNLVKRMDRQLAGRSARRGQPGSVQFYGSLDDELMRAIPDDRVEGLKKRFGEDGDGPFTHRTLQKTFDRAQQQFQRYFRQVRESLLAQDIAEEETDKMLFGQDKL